ncbi:MAG: diguanylate cyclase [Mycolicibacterium aromaticivorans]|nr:diguanylate cyclase [Mycolicibacterium aromaticivorans]
MTVIDRTFVGYARCSMDEQDLVEQRQHLRELGVGDDRIYIDQALTGTDTERPALDQALAAVHAGDTLVVSKLDRLARSVADARAIGETLAGRGGTLSLGAQRYDPAEPLGNMFFGILATVAEFEVDVLRTRSRERLTGLTTRDETVARLQAALEFPRVHGPYHGVLYCDIDNFDAINDAWGRSFGDVVLATLAVRIRQCVRQGDTVGRIGDDEALLLLPGVHSLANVAQVAEKIRSRAAEPISHSGVTVNATMSIGGTLAITGESASALTARVMSAMRSAQQAGRNTVACI